MNLNPLILHFFKFDPKSLSSWFNLQNVIQLVPLHTHTRRPLGKLLPLASVFLLTWLNSPLPVPFSRSQWWWVMVRFHILLLQEKFRAWRGKRSQAMSFAQFRCIARDSSLEGSAHNALRLLRKRAHFPKWPTDPTNFNWNNHLQTEFRPSNSALTRLHF